MSTEDQLTRLLIKMFSIIGMVFVVLPIAIFIMFKSVAMELGYVVVLLALIAVFDSPDVDEGLKVIFTVLAFMVPGLMMLLTAFPETNRFVLIVSYLFVFGFAVVLYTKRHNRKKKERTESGDNKERTEEGIGGAVSRR